MDHFKASSSSCPELDRTGKNGMPVTPPRSTRIRNRLPWSNRTSPATGSPSPRVLTPPTFRESSERRRRARDSSVGEGPSGEAVCHGKARPEEAGDMLELAVAGAMIAVLELDRLSGMARGVGEVKQRQGRGGSEE
ncbi:hypothetical protein NLU13_8639 [Sarocladium strictum]|uniref:Uncharacterized protein n=1 Tax=Sarocladium strictum TaxID=5046 RepID=A0AA39GD98_SARSR|nr:hypothetical protein NLU13_8639 [Sarocladium strictum]